MGVDIKISTYNDNMTFLQNQNPPLIFIGDTSKKLQSSLNILNNIL